MANIRINNTKREIVITKAFAKKAEQFRSDEYYELREAKNDNPTFKVVVNKAAKRDTMKGLTFKFIKQYVEKNGTEAQMDEFETMTKNEDGIQSMSYGEVKEWFIVSFPEVVEIFKQREDISKKVKEAKLAQQKARIAELAKAA